MLFAKRRCTLRKPNLPLLTASLFPFPVIPRDVPCFALLRRGDFDKVIYSAVHSRDAPLHTRLLDIAPRSSIWCFPFLVSFANFKSTLQVAMAPSSETVTTTEPEYVTFHASQGRGKRLVLKGDEMKDTFESIPVVDFTKAFSSSIEDRKSVAKEVGDAFRKVGFLYARGHGVSEDLQDRTREAMKQFFSQPVEEKMKLHINNSAAISGYEALLETKLDETTRGGASMIPHYASRVNALITR